MRGKSGGVAQVAEHLPSILACVKPLVQSLVLQEKKKLLSSNMTLKKEHELGTAAHTLNSMYLGS
jgi:hypothetical protein